MLERGLGKGPSLKTSADQAHKLDIAKVVVRQSIENSDVLEDYLDPLVEREEVVETEAVATAFDWLKEALGREAPWLLLTMQGSGTILITPQRTSRYAKAGVAPFLLELDFGLARPQGDEQATRTEDDLDVVKFALPALEVWNALPAVVKLNDQSVEANLEVVLERMREYAELKALGLKEKVGMRSAAVYEKRTKWLTDLQRKRLGQLIAEVITICKNRWSDREQSGRRLVA